MTTIAFDGQILAADTASCMVDDAENATARVSTICKIAQLGNGWLLGWAGSPEDAMVLLDALQDQIPDEQPTGRVILDLSEDSPEEGLQVNGILVHHTHGSYTLELTRRGHVVLIPSMAQHVVMGNGGHIALAAMLAGAPANRAVDIACDLAIGTGRPVLWYEIHDPETLYTS